MLPAKSGPLPSEGAPCRTNRCCPRCPPTLLPCGGPDTAQSLRRRWTLLDDPFFGGSCKQNVRFRSGRPRSTQCDGSVSYLKFKPTAIHREERNTGCVSFWRVASDDATFSPSRLFQVVSGATAGQQTTSLVVFDHFQDHSRKYPCLFFQVERFGQGAERTSGVL